MTTSLRHRIRPWLVSLLLVAAPVGFLSAQAADQGARASTPAQGTHAASAATSYLGEPFQMGGTGPGFDMPGLSMAAWATAGVRLPHTVESQLAAGSEVPASEAEPGDLVFYYSNTTEGIYVGDGRIVVADYASARVVTKFVAQLSNTTLTFVRPS